MEKTGDIENIQVSLSFEDLEGRLDIIQRTLHLIEDIKKAQCSIGGSK
jgi:hypothetical protein